MKVMTVLGTRPEIIRLSRVIPRLDEACDHILVHTGQNFDPNLSEQFFRELHVREPNHHLGIAETNFGAQVGKLLFEVQKIIESEKPDRLLILGDTNSGLSAIIAKRLGIPVFHMEAGNRCYDDRVPEEVNRRVIDHSSDVLMPYTERSRFNLLREGFSGQRVFVIGNPINEVLLHYAEQIDASTILERLGLSTREYFLVTLHRAENVDPRDRFERYLSIFSLVHKAFGLPVIISTHPRTRSRLANISGSDKVDGLHFLDAFGFPDFVSLEKNAKCVLSDSGTVQEECCILKVPNITLSDVTERPETIECGSNIIGGCSRDIVVSSIENATRAAPNWESPAEYRRTDVSVTVRNILTSYVHMA